MLILIAYLIKFSKHCIKNEYALEIINYFDLTTIY